MSGPNPNGGPGPPRGATPMVQINWSVLTEGSCYLSSCYWGFTVADCSIMSMQPLIFRTMTDDLNMCMHIRASCFLGASASFSLAFIFVVLSFNVADNHSVVCVNLY